MPRTGLLVGPWVAAWKTSWRFSADELIFTACNLKRLLDILHFPQKPEAGSLIALRMDLTSVEWLIAARCPGLPELQLRVEHFDHNDWQSFVSIDSIVGRQADAPPTRQSA